MPSGHLRLLWVLEEGKSIMLPEAPKPTALDELSKATEGLVNASHNPASAHNYSVEIFDRSAALTRVDNDENLLFDLANMFCAEEPSRLATIRAALERKDAEGLRRAAHSMRGAISAFAASRAFEASSKLEELAATGELAGAGAAFESLALQTDALRRTLANFCKQDKRIPASAGAPGHTLKNSCEKNK
jgi:HPt (histidine-containing phosphotransfer) domain-containing protein